MTDLKIRREAWVKIGWRLLGGGGGAPHGAVRVDLAELGLVDLAVEPGYDLLVGVEELGGFVELGFGVG